MAWLVAVLGTVGAAIVWDAVVQYWRQSERFFRHRDAYLAILKTRWLRESFMRIMLVGAISGTLLATSMWGLVGLSGGSEPGFEGREVLFWFSFLSFGLGSLVMLVFAPLVILYNRPSFLVAPHDRGKTGGLRLKRLYRE